MWYKFGLLTVRVGYIKKKCFHFFSNWTDKIFYNLDYQLRKRVPHISTKTSECSIIMDTRSISSSDYDSGGASTDTLQFDEVVFLQSNIKQGVYTVPCKMPAKCY